MVFIPQYRIILRDNKKNIKQFLNQEKFVYILDEPPWKYSIIDELEQFQLFPLELEYKNYILELCGSSQTTVVYRIKT